uniref:NB-ARC domain-containing protein n=1 Tax=Setaria italica TaxID=4555 RepID=K3Y2G3_SETIT
MSLHDLPIHLRSCFLYCSLYPKDYKIRRKLISKLWIAEGFVEDRGDGTTMEVAEYYLTELTQGSLLQVTERNTCGRARTFVMHDLVGEATSIIAKLEKFGIAYSGCGITQVTHEARHLSIQRGAQSLHSLSSSRLRSFILFDTEVPSRWIYDVLSHFRLLRVLCLRFTNIEQVPGMVTELYNLRYVDFSNTNVKHIPASFRKLTNLQVLDLRFTYVQELPCEINLLTSFTGLLQCYNICHLKNLQALGIIQANKNLVSHLGNMTLMRSLAIMKVRQSYIAELWSSLTKMPNLSRLLISACDMDEILNLNMLEALPNLKLLWMAGKLEGGMLPPLFAEFENLTWLKLDWSDLKKDTISSFSHMLNLVDLRLFGAYGGQQVTFCIGWFRKLKTLQLADMEHLTQIEMEEQKMVSLHVLELSSLRNLKSVPEGIKYITTLNNMFLIDMSIEFIERLQGSDNHIVQHVRNIHKFGPSDSQAGNIHFLSMPTI